MQGNQSNNYSSSPSKEHGQMKNQSQLYNQQNKNQEDSIQAEIRQQKMKNKSYIQKRNEYNDLNLKQNILFQNDTQLQNKIEGWLNQQFESFKCQITTKLTQQEDKLDKKIQILLRDPKFQLVQQDNKIQAIESSILDLQSNYRKLISEIQCQSENKTQIKSKNTNINIEEASSIQQKWQIEIMNEQNEVKKLLEKLSQESTEINQKFQEQNKQMNSKLQDIENQFNYLNSNGQQYEQYPKVNQNLRFHQDYPSIDPIMFQNLCNSQKEIEQRLTKIDNFMQKCVLTNDKVEEIWKCINLMQIDSLNRKVDNLIINVGNLSFNTKIAQ